MFFFEIEAFLKAAEGDTTYAAASLGRSGLDICLAIEKLQKFTMVKLFDDPLSPSRNNLTEAGKVYFEYASKAMLELQNGVVAVWEHNQKARGGPELSMSLDESLTKSVLAKSVATLTNRMVSGRVVPLNIVTSSVVQERHLLSFHVIFGSLSSENRLFFKINWSVSLAQGLYAGRNYLRVMGIPENACDLVSHSVVVCGESPQDVNANKYNWHIRPEYELPKFTPTIIVSSRSSLPAVVKSNLGIAPLFCHESENLCRILPWICGPSVNLSFAIRNNIPEELREQAEAFSDILRNELESMNIKTVSKSL